MVEEPIRYRSDDEDSRRWSGFSFRPDDIIISTRSKSGTTWMQMICALLVFGRTEFPEPLGRLSPWFDWLGEPRDQLVDRLEAQTHRRFLKTHTPLAGLPTDPRVTRILVARHPLDAAVSLYHQGLNLDRRRMAELTGRSEPPQAEPASRPSLAEWVERWIEDDSEPTTNLDSLPGFLHHLNDGWSRRHQANVILVRYDDLLADLGGQMAALATALKIEPDPSTWHQLVEAAGFEAMAARANELAPDPANIFKDRSRFFRSGRAGDGRRAVDERFFRAYRQRVASLGDPDLVRWLDGA